MKTITPNELQSVLRFNPGAAVLDVRTPLEYAEVHVSKAVLVPLDELDPVSLVGSGAAKKDAPVYILCRSGGRATKAAEKLAAAGFTEPIVVEGGTLAWISAGLPVEKSDVKVISLERQVRIAAGSLVVIGVLLSYFVHPWLIGISAFVGAGLVFAGITDWCGMGLLLAKAPWNKAPAPACELPKARTV